jgi:hypothetical protein
MLSLTSIISSVQLKSSSTSLWFSQHCEICLTRSITQVRLGPRYETTVLTDSYLCIKGIRRLLWPEV